MAALMETGISVMIRNTGLSGGLLADCPKRTAASQISDHLGSGGSCYDFCYYLVIIVDARLEHVLAYAA